MLPVVNCPDCNREVSPYAEKCPGCDCVVRDYFIPEYIEKREKKEEVKRQEERVREQKEKEDKLSKGYEEEVERYTTVRQKINSAVLYSLRISSCATFIISLNAQGSGNYSLANMLGAASVFLFVCLYAYCHYAGTHFGSSAPRSGTDKIVHTLQRGQVFKGIGDYVHHNDLKEQNRISKQQRDDARRANGDSQFKTYFD